MGKVGDAYVDVKPDMDSFGSWLRAGLSRASGDADRQGRNTGLRFGNSMATGIGSSFGRGTFTAGLVAVMAGPLAAVTSGLSAGLTAVASSVVAASGSAAAAVPLFTSMAQGMGTVKLGSMGVADALKESLKAQEALGAGGKLTEAQQQKLAAAMKNLAPAARETVMEILALGKGFKAMQQSVQQKLFSGLALTLRGLAAKFLPLMTRRLGESAVVLNTLAKNFAKTNTSARAMRDWDRILAGNNVIMASLGLAATRAFSAIRAGLVPLIPFGQRLALSLNNGAAALQRWAESATGARQITTFMNQAFKSAGLLLRIFRNLAVALAAIFSAGVGTGDSLLAMLERLTAQFAAWTKSTEGKSKLAAWFAEGREVMIEVGRLIRDIALAFGKLSGTADPSDFVASLRQAIRPILDLIQQLNAQGVGQQLIDSLTKIGQALVDMNAGGGLSAFLSTLATIATAVARLVQVVPGGTAAIASLATVLGTLAAIRFVGTVTGITGMAKSLRGLVKSQGGVAGSLDTVRLKGMFMGDALRAAGTKAASGMSTAWTGIQLGALKAKSSLTNLGYTAAETGLRMGSAITGGASKAASGIGRFGKAVGSSAASLGRMAAMNIRVAASLTLMSVRAAAAAVIQGIVRVATLAWAAAVRVLNFVMMMNPLGLVIGLLALLALGIYIAWKRSETFRAVVMAVWNAIRTYVVTNLIAIRAIITAVWGWIGPYVMAAVSLVARIIRTYFAIYRAVIGAALAAIRAVVSGNFGQIRSVITAHVAAIGAVIRVGFVIIGSIIRITLAVIRALVTGNFGQMRATVASAVGNIRAAVSGAFSAVRTAVSTTANAVRSNVSAAFDAVVSKVRSAVGSVVSAISGLRSKVIGAVSGAAGWLAGTGADIIRGLVGGIRSMAGAAASAAKDVIAGAVSAAKNALLSRSPSRVFITLGRSAVEGFVVGIQTSMKAAQNATAKLIEAVRRAARSMIDAAQITPADRVRLINEQNRLLRTLANNAARRSQGSSFTGAQMAAIARQDAAARARLADIAGDLRRGNTMSSAELRSIGAQRDAMIRLISATYSKVLAPARKALDQLNIRIANTTAQLASLREARASVAASIRDVGLGARDLFGAMMEGVAPDPASVIERLKANLAAVTKFRADMAALLKKGISAEVVQQIAAQGVAAGGQMAQTLLASTPAQVQALNATYAAIGNTATSTGNLVAGGMYDAGIKAAEGLLKGLQARRKQLEAYLALVANHMVAVLKRTLKIKSPSAVMAAEVGAPVGLGIVGGLLEKRRIMDRALASFIAVPSLAIPKTVTGHRLPAMFGQRDPTQIRVYIGEREITDIVKVEIGNANDQLADEIMRGRRAVV